MRLVRLVSVLAAGVILGACGSAGGGGPTLSNSALAVHPLAETLKVPILAVSTTGIHIVPDCNFPQTTPCRYVFRDSLGEQTAIPDNIQSYASDGHPSTGVLLVAQDDKFS